MGLRKVIASVKVLVMGLESSLLLLLCLLSTVFFFSCVVPIFGLLKSGMSLRLGV